MRRFDRYRVADDDEVQASYFNGVHEDVDLRLHAVEEKSVGWDEQVERFMALQPQFGAQFTVSGSVWRAGDGPRSALRNGRTGSADTIAAVSAQGARTRSPQCRRSIRFRPR